MVIKPLFANCEFGTKIVIKEEIIDFFKIYYYLRLNEIATTNVFIYKQYEQYII